MRALDMNTIPKVSDVGTSEPDTDPQQTGDTNDTPPKIVNRFGRWFIQSPDGKLTRLVGNPPEGATPKEETTVKQPPISKAQPKARKGENPLEANVTQQELANRFASGFNMAAWLARSEAHFEPREFADTSRNVLELINLFPALKVLLRLLGPAFAALDIWKAVREVMDGRRRADKAILQMAPNEPKQPFAQ